MNEMINEINEERSLIADQIKDKYDHLKDAYDSLLKTIVDLKQRESELFTNQEMIDRANTLSIELNDNGLFLYQTFHMYNQMKAYLSSDSYREYIAYEQAKKTILYGIAEKERRMKLMYNDMMRLKNDMIIIT